MPRNATAKTWNSAKIGIPLRAADAYDQTRPRYPQAVIEQVAEIAQLSAHSNVLEIGCGLAIATLPFAELGCSLLCLEPNPDFYQLAQKNCQPYANVTLQNSSFEEWHLTAGAFDAVIAASSFHRVTPEIGYPKVAAALRPGGAFILLWNKELQPSYQIYDQLSEVYHTHAPDLRRDYEDPAAQAAVLDVLGQMALQSGHFKAMKSGHFTCDVTYSVDQYLTLLNTYSPHLQLES